MTESKSKPEAFTFIPKHPLPGFAVARFRHPLSSFAHFSFQTLISSEGNFGNFPQTWRPPFEKQECSFFSMPMVRRRTPGPCSEPAFCNYQSLGFVRLRNCFILNYFHHHHNTFPFKDIEE